MQALDTAFLVELINCSGVIASYKFSSFGFEVVPGGKAFQFYQKVRD